jgi:integrase
MMVSLSDGGEIGAPGEIRTHDLCLRRADILTRPRGRANVRGGKGTAARTINLLAAIFSYAISLGLRENNPCHGVRRFGWNKVQTYLNPEQMAAVGDGLTAMSARNPRAAAMIRLLALTGARRGEIVNLKWKYMDEYQRVLRLPTSKTGERVIILNKSALAVLRGISRTRGSDFVFAGVEPTTPYQGLPKAWRDVTSRSNVSARLHDLRHHFASVAAELGYALPTIAALLGHRVPGTTGGYVHLPDEVQRAAADKIAAEIENRLSGHRATIIPLPEKNSAA